MIPIKLIFYFYYPRFLKYIFSRDIEQWAGTSLFFFSILSEPEHIVEALSLLKIQFAKN